jgi:23S rRNA (adenine2503-C2)-methyltransferase
MKVNIGNLLPDELEYECVHVLSQPKYRADQILNEIYKKHTTKFEEMTLLPKELRKIFAHKYIFSLPQIEKKLESTDGTIKYLFKLNDGTCIESVLIREEKRKTVCFSSQVGCALGCSFCATGQGGFKRDLVPAEITGQILAIECDIGEKVNNCVAMGQGEPLLNFNALKKAISLFIHKKTFMISNRHITVSTVGIIPSIKKMADEILPCKLAVSLHSAREEIRNELIPISKKYSLRELRDVLEYYADQTQNRITFEYILLSNKNDSKKDAAALHAFVKGLPAFINLIPFNSVSGLPYERPSKNRIDYFKKVLENRGIEVFVRQEKGTDILAACGQLTQK